MTSFLTLGSASLLLGGTLYWDFDNSVTGLQAGSGTWDTNPGFGNRNWKVSSAGAGADISWSQNDDAVFQTSGTSLVTLATDIGVNSITFNGTGYTIAATSPNTLILTGAGGNITANAAATISAPLAGTVGLTKLGSATLTLSGTNTYTGVTTISNGVLSVAWRVGGQSRPVDQRRCQLGVQRWHLALHRSHGQHESCVHHHYWPDGDL